MCCRLFLADSVKTVSNSARGSLPVGFVPTHSPYGVTSLDVSSSKVERALFLEQARALLVTGVPAASSPPALAVEGGTSRACSSLLYRSAMTQVSSAHIAMALPRVAINASMNSAAFLLEMSSAYSRAAENRFPLDASLQVAETTSKGLMGLIN